jgi:hypothetical protein
MRNPRIDRRYLEGLPGRLFRSGQSELYRPVYNPLGAFPGYSDLLVEPGGKVVIKGYSGSRIPMPSW